MALQGFKTFREQVFRRIGYTVGLSELLEFAALCQLLADMGSVEIKELTALVQKQFNVEPKFARGKIDVARALGLLFSIRNRYSLSGPGRVLLALKSTYGSAAKSVRGFWLRRVVEHDADMTLTLLVAASRLCPDDDLESEFLKSLDELLRFKRSAFGELVTAFTLRKELPTLLTVRESQPKTPRFSKGKVFLPPKRGKSPYECIEIPELSLPHYVRHTITPRKGWLGDLALIDRTSLQLSAEGTRLLFFLRNADLLRNGFAVISPDEEVLSVVTGHKAPSGLKPINNMFYDEMTSVTYSGMLPAVEDWNVQDFFDSLAGVYERVKLKNFEQAEMIAVREALLVPLLVEGRTINFERLLKEAVRAFPGKLYRLSSRREAGAYISLRKLA